MVARLTAGAISNTAVPQVSSIELGNASDTTIARSAAGVATVEGNIVPSPASQATGDTLYRAASNWARLAKGLAGQFQKMNSGATAPEWVHQNAYTKNYIINPGMRISQENDTASGTTTGYYPVDQWRHAYVQDGTLTAQQVASATPGGSTHRFRLTVTTGDASLAAGQYAVLEQKIEGSQVADFLWGTASARDIVVRFGFKGPAGTYAVTARNAANDRSYLREFTITGGQANTDTVQTVTFPGDTSGTWPTGNVLGMSLAVILATGSTFQTTADAWQAGSFLGTSSTTNGIATTGAVFELFDVGMYLDPNSTGVAPDFVLPSIDDDSRACQRYWQKFLVSSRFSASVVGEVLEHTIMYVVPMRNTPSTTVTAGTRGKVTSHTITGVTPTTARMRLQNNATGSCQAVGELITLNARM